MTLPRLMTGPVQFVLEGCHFPSRWVDVSLRARHVRSGGGSLGRGVVSNRQSAVEEASNTCQALIPATFQTSQRRNYYRTTLYSRNHERYSTYQPACAFFLVSRFSHALMLRNDDSSMARPRQKMAEGPRKIILPILPSFQLPKAQLRSNSFSAWLSIRDSFGPSLIRWSLSIHGQGDLGQTLHHHHV
jgi:hypothetical protein